MKKKKSNTERTFCLLRSGTWCGFFYVDAYIHKVGVNQAPPSAVGGNRPYNFWEAIWQQITEVLKYAYPLTLSPDNFILGAVVFRQGNIVTQGTLGNQQTLIVRIQGQRSASCIESVEAEDAVTHRMMHRSVPRTRIIGPNIRSIAVKKLRGETWGESTGIHPQGFSRQPCITS